MIITNTTAGLLIRVVFTKYNVLNNFWTNEFDGARDNLPDHCSTLFSVRIHKKDISNPFMFCELNKITMIRNFKITVGVFIGKNKSFFRIAFNKRFDNSY